MTAHAVFGDAGSRFASGRFSRGESRERGPVYQIKAMTEKAGTRQAGGLAGQRTTSPRLDSTRLDSTLYS